MMKKGLVDIGMFLEPVDTEGLDYIRSRKVTTGSSGCARTIRSPGKNSSQSRISSRKPLILPERTGVQSEIANWFGKDFNKLQIAFTSNLGTNAGVMAFYGLGYRYLSPVRQDTGGLTCSFSGNSSQRSPLVP